MIAIPHFWVIPDNCHEYDGGYELLDAAAYMLLFKDDK